MEAQYPRILVKGPGEGVAAKGVPVYQLQGPSLPAGLPLRGPGIGEGKIRQDAEAVVAARKHVRPRLRRGTREAGAEEPGAAVERTLPQLGERGRERQLRDLTTLTEGVRADLLQRLAAAQRLQMNGAGKGVFADADQVLGQCELRQSRTGHEGTHVDVGQTVGQVQAFQLAQPREGAGADTGDAFVDLERRDLLGIFRPGSGQELVAVHVAVHIPASKDLQYPLAVTPMDVLAAAIVSARREGKAVEPLGLAVGSPAFGVFRQIVHRGIRQIGISVPAKGAFVHSLRLKPKEGNTPQIVAVLESGGTDSGHGSLHSCLGSGAGTADQPGAVLVVEHAVDGTVARIGFVHLKLSRRRQKQERRLVAKHRGGPKACQRGGDPQQPDLRERKSAGVDLRDRIRDGIIAGEPAGTAEDPRHFLGMEHAASGKDRIALVHRNALERRAQGKGALPDLAYRSGDRD